MNTYESKSIVTLLLAGFIILFSLPLLAVSDLPTISIKEIKGPVVTQKQIKASGGYTFNVPGVGNFTINKADTPMYAGNKCQLDLHTVKQALIERYKKRPPLVGLPGHIALKAWKITETGELYCREVGGGDCMIFVTHTGK